MNILNKEQFEEQKEEVKKKILDGAVFVYPTDTIYGIGCDAANFDSVARLRLIKGLPDEKPVSVIAPSKQWIIDNCEISKQAEEWLDKLPGPYTLILKLKNKDCIANNISGSDTIGVRIPDHFFSHIATEINRPIVTTSANVCGNLNMTCLDDLDNSIGNKVDFVIDEGKLSGKASTVINLTKDEVEYLRK